MTRQTLTIALASALVIAASQAGANPIAKQLAGPPSEFAAMKEASLEASAVSSKSALIPVTLTQNKQGLWQWQGNLPVESSDLRFVAFTGAADDWQLSMRAPYSARSQDVARLVKDQRETLYGIENNEYPADYYSFENLTTGDWTIDITAPSATQTQGFLLLNSESEYRLSGQLNSNSQRVGDRISFTAYGFERDKASRAGQTSPVIASLVHSAQLRVTAPDGEVFTEVLFDDGLHGDGKVGDGVFGGDFLAAQAGEYNVQVVANGQTPAGTPFLRTTEHLVPVLDAEVRLNSDFATSRVVDDQRLSVDLAVETNATADHFRAYAEVWGVSRKDGRTSVPVAWIGGMVNNVNDSLSLGLDGRWIALANAQGPFELRNLRVEDADYFLPLLRAERVSLDVAALPRAATDRAPSVIDEAMVMGPRPANIAQNRAGSRLLLVHGYCSGDAWGPVAYQFASSSVFADFNQNRSHDNFAIRIYNFGVNYDSYGIVAHSQGGAASVHLYSYYWSGLDFAGPGRLIQSVGTPYQGTALAGNLAALGEVFGAGCGTNYDLTYNGASQWLSGIPSFARAAANYYTTSFTDNFFSYDYCHLATDLFLDDPDDGTTERSRGALSGGVNRGHKTGWCHTTGMRDPAQYRDSSRNSTMNANAAR